MTAEKQTKQILKAHKARLIRSRKHHVWRLPDGQKYVMASTPSDRRVPIAQLTLLRRMLNLADPYRGRAGERRTKRRKPGRDGCVTLKISNTIPTSRQTLKEQLSALVVKGVARA